MSDSYLSNRPSCSNANHNGRSDLLAGCCELDEDGEDEGEGIIQGGGEDVCV